MICLFNTEQNHKEINATITYACFDSTLIEMSLVGAFLLGFFMGGVTGVNMKNSNLDAFDRFKCPMNTNRNHYKANFDNIVYREQTSYSTSQNSKTYSPKWLELKDIANV